MFRLAHISDIHLGPLPPITPRELVSKRITGYVNWHRNRRKRMIGNILDSLMNDIGAAKPDHIAITGDMINLAAAAEIDNARVWLNAAGDPRHISLVPGNHDAYVPGAFKKICAAWQPFMCGDDQQATNPARSLFPYLRKRGNVAIIGVSTATASPPFMASGFFGPRQAKKLMGILTESSDMIRVVLIHHPPVHGATHAYKRMFGIDRFSQVLAEAGAELVLHGHTHLETLNWLPGPNAPVPVVGVASASEAPGGKRPPSGYNMITIDEHSAEPTAQLQRYGLDASSERYIQIEKPVNLAK